MYLKLPQQANEPLRIAVMKQSQNSMMMRNKVLKRSVIKSVESVVNEYGIIEHHFTIGKPNLDGHYLCRLQFSQFPIVLAYNADSQSWLSENGELFTTEAVLGFMSIELTTFGLNLQ